MLGQRRLVVPLLEFTSWQSTGFVLAAWRMRIEGAFSTLRWNSAMSTQSGKEVVDAGPTLGGGVVVDAAAALLWVLALGLRL